MQNPTFKLSVAFTFAAATLLTAAQAGMIVTVPGTADPWLANAVIDNQNTPEPPDEAPFQSPVLACSVSEGQIVVWTATGMVGHPGDDSGPDGNANVVVSRWIGANNGIADLPNTPINALLGVWAFSGGGGIPFYMGSSGSATAPAGAAQLFLGVMDAYGWANNDGAFRVDLQCAPDTAMTAGLLVVALGSLVALRRRN